MVREMTVTIRTIPAQRITRPLEIDYAGGGGIVSQPTELIPPAGGGVSSEQQRVVDIQKARQQLAEDLRIAQSAQERRNVLLQFSQQVQEAKLKEAEEKMRRGEIESYSTDEGRYQYKLVEAQEQPSQEPITERQVGVGYKGVPIVEYYQGEKKLTPKLTQTPKQQEYGIGGKLEFYDNERKVGEELRVEQATNWQEESKIKFKEDVLGKSGVYYVVPYIGQEIGELVSKKLGTPDIPVSGIRSKPLYYGARFIQSFASTIPLFTFFSPAMKTGAEDIIFKEYPRQSKVTYKEVQIPVARGGKVEVLSAYKIKSVTPPPEVHLTTGTRELLGFPEIAKGTIGKTQTRITTTLFPSQLGKEFYVGDISSKQKAVSSIMGTSQPINLRKAYPTKLTPIDKMLAERLSGRVPTKETLKMFSKEIDFLYGDITKTIYYKGARLTKFNEAELIRGFQPYGKRVTYTRYLAGVREVKVSETSLFEVYRGEIQFKDVTKPFARATGKELKMTGTTFRLKEAITFPEEKVISFKSFEKPALKANLQSGILKTTKVTLPKFRLTIVSPSIRTIPKATATEVSQRVTPALFTSSATALSQFSKINQQSLQQPKIVQEQIGKEKEVSKLIEKQQPKIVLMPKIIEKQQPKLMERLIEKQQERLIEKSLTKPQITPPITTFRTFQTTPELILPSPSRKVSPFGLRQVPAYSVSLKRRGKFKQIATDLTKGQALSLGSKRTMTNLARTFKIARTGKTKEIFGEDFLPSGKIFRGYKIQRGKKIYTPDQFIQRTQANLQTKQEKAELQESKRLKQLIYGF